MVLHPRFIEQLVLDKEMTAIQRASGFREHRAGDREIAAQSLQQRIGNRADIALRGRVEGRAVFEKELTAALLLQPAQRGQRIGDSFRGRNRARFQRYHDGVHFLRCAVRHADGLHCAHAFTHQHVGEVGSAGKIIGDAAEQWTCCGVLLC